MTETFSTSPERTISAPTIKNAPEALQLETLDSVVGMGATIDQEYQDGHKKASKRDLDVNRHLAIDKLLTEQGFSKGESEQDQADYKLAYETYKMALDHDRDSWLMLSEEDGTLRPRDVAFKNVFEHYHKREALEGADAESSSTDADTADVHESSESDLSSGDDQVDQPDQTGEASSTLSPTEFDHAHETMHQLLDEYAKKVAERSRSIVERTKTGSDIEATGNLLSDYMTGIASELYFELEATGLPHDQIVAEVDAFIAESTESTLQKVEAHRMAEYNNSRPYMKKVYDKWADWSDDKRLKGGRGKKMAVMAAGGAVVGFALAPLVGAVGAGLVTGAVAVAGTRSIGRQLAGGFMKKRDKRFAQAQTEEMRRDLDTIYRSNTDRTVDTEASDGDNPYAAGRNIDLIEFMNQRSHEYRVRNRNRVLAGTAIAMSVGLLSSTAANALTDVDWSFGKLRDIDLRNPFDGIDAKGIKDADHDGILDADDNDSNNDGISDFDDRDGDGIRNGQDLTPDGVDAPELDRDGDGVRNWMDADPDDPSVTEAVDQGLELSEAARTVTPGEGGFQTLKEMGVPERKWEVIWEDAGTKLADAGKTYRMDDGRWGWDHTMRLSDNDLRIFQAAASRHGVSL